MISVKHKGDFKNVESLLNRITNLRLSRIMERYGQMGVNALSSATPIDSGETANSWDYRIIFRKNTIRIEWTNSNIAGNVPVAILLQYGHATKSGSFINGIDFINPALKPVFDLIAEEAWKEVTSR